ncbi:MAG: hypothetical protein U0905_22480 [Pirellulales bacterium]
MSTISETTPRSTGIGFGISGRVRHDTERTSHSLSRRVSDASVDTWLVWEFQFDNILHRGTASTIDDARRTPAV